MIKTILKRIVLVFGVLTLVGIGFVYHEWNFRPMFINNFFNRTLIQLALESPELLTNLRMLDQFGLKSHNQQLDDASVARADQLFEKVKSIKATLNSYDDRELSESEQLSKQVANELIDFFLNQKKYRYHNYPLNQIWGVQLNLPTFLATKHVVETEDDALNYLIRLEKVDTKVDQIMEGLLIRENLSILPPRFIATKVIAGLQTFIAEDPLDNILCSSFRERLEKSEAIDEKQQSELLDACQNKLKNFVYPAYGKYLAYMNRILPATTDDAGVWKFPDGDAYYQSQLAFYTTTDMTAAEIHDLGLKETKRIQDEILAILQGEGYDTSKGFSHAIFTMAEDPKFYYPDSDKGRAAIIQDYKAMIAEIYQRMDEVIHSPVIAEVDVKRIPLFKEKDSAGAYYEHPSLDGSRPGTFFANLHDIRATPKYGMRTLAYHEAVPGHHYQIVTANTIDDLPFFRRYVPSVAFSEGWALYAERLAYEMGLQSDPFDNIGRLQAELFRAVRLVVDTGLHYKRWGRDQAIDYMYNNTGMAKSDIVAEIERYIVNPGQATAYKIGMNKLLELRQRMQEALGSKYDIKDFHDIVLLNGPLPLKLVERNIEDFISKSSLVAH